METKHSATLLMAHLGCKSQLALPVPGMKLHTLLSRQGQGLAPIQASWEGFYNYRPSVGSCTQLFHRAKICLVLEIESPKKKVIALDDISLPSDILPPTISKAVIKLVGQMLAKTFPGSFQVFLGQVGTHDARNINTEFCVFLEETQVMHIAYRTKERECEKEN